MKKKLLTTAILLVAAIALVVTTMLATMAYLTSTTAVSNTFTVGNVKIEMFESPVDSDGQVLDTFVSGTKKTADGNSYHLVPGKSYVKDPTIYIDSKSDNCYLFVKANNQIRAIEDGNFGEDSATKPTMREQLLANGWKEIYQVNADESIYCYVGTDRKNKFSDADGDKKWDGMFGVFDVAKEQAADNTLLAVNLFNEFTTDAHCDSTIAHYGGAKVTLTAFAIQGDILTDGSTAPIEETTSFKGAQRLWNIIAETIEYEKVVIPNDVINATDNLIKDPNA